MKFRTTFTLCAVCAIFLFALNLSAATVTMPEAQTVALNFFKLNATSLPRVPLRATLCYTGHESDGIPTFYVFNISPVRGFVIVSASDNDNPVIGYSTESRFGSDFSKIGLTDWLKNWSEEIHYVIKNNVVANPKAAALWTAYRQGIQPANSRSSGIGPLCSTTWAQNNPDNTYPVLYNGDCPYDYEEDINAVTGCVATAMAQIMRYWNYPVTGTGISTYDDEQEYGYQENYGVQTFNYSTVHFNWGAMPDSLGSLTTSTQDSAVALLMYACGVSVYMDYSPYGSGAWVIDSESTNGASSQLAYPTYFGYNAHTIQPVNYTNYSTDAWMNILEGEFNAGRPVQYQGYSDEGGHSWVCDGYSTGDMLHMNWGWGGIYNGWYSVTNLDPDFEVFDYNMFALIGIEPGVYAQAKQTVICSSDSTQLFVIGAPTVATYSWSPATGLSCTTCAKPYAAPAVTTTYSVTVDSGGNSYPSSVTVQVNKPGTLNYSLSDSSLCEGNSSTLSLPGMSGARITPLTGVSWTDSTDAVLSPSATTTYHISNSTSVCGAGDTGSLTIHVTQYSPVSFQLSDSVVCEDDDATLYYSGLTNVTVSSTDGNYYIYSNSITLEPYNSTTSYTVSGTTSCGSTYSQTFNIYTVEYDGLSYTLSKPDICHGDSTLLIVNSASSVTVTPSNEVEALGNNEFMLFPSYSTYFEIEGENTACDEYGYEEVYVEVVNSDSINYTLYSTTICEGNEEEIDLSGIYAPVQSSPQVNFTFSDATDAYAYVYPDSTTTYVITAQTVCGKVDTSHIPITVVPEFSYTLVPGAVCSGGSSLLTILGMTDISIYPSTGVTEIDATHFRLSPTTTTYYEVDGYNACEDEYEYEEVIVNVVEPNILNYTLSDSDICSGYSVELELYGIENPQITPNTYLYSLDSTDYYAYLYPYVTTTYTVSGTNVCGGTVSQPITVHVLAEPNFSLEPAAICSGGYSDLTFSGLTNVSIYPTTNSLWLNDSTIELYPSSSTDYELEGYDCSGEYYYDDVFVAVDPANGIAYEVEDSFICPGEETYVVVTGATDITISPYVYLTYEDSTDAYGYLDPQSTTTYTVSGISLCSGKEASSTFTITVNGTSTYHLSNPTVCNNDSTLLTVNGLDEVNISPDIDISYLSEDQIYLFPTTTTTYEISGYSMCDYTYEDFDVTVPVGSPSIATEAFDTVICEGDSAFICASAGFVTYQWNDGQTGLCIGATQAGNYIVTGTDAAGCSSQSAPVHISAISLTQPDITKSHDTLYAPAAQTYQWMFNGEDITGATQRFIIPSYPGSYTVKISATGCSETSDAFVYTAVNNVSANGDIQIYPNPSPGKWTVNTGQAWIGSLCEVFDDAGRLVYSSQTENARFEITIDLAAGVYIMKITSNADTFTTKLVKQ